MRRLNIAVLSVALVFIGWALADRASAQVKSEDLNIAIVDNCDPSDPAWNPTGGCALHKGTVSFGEFAALLFSPLVPGTPVGHPSWRNEPSYVSTVVGRTVRVKNWGGRAHTFTQVANFGGGVVPVLNGTLIPAPECAALTVVPPGGTGEVSGLDTGTHKFQCCFHPWMRAAIEVN
jgi:plastocyanin